jgi:hypothetical protein
MMVLTATKAEDAAFCLVVLDIEAPELMAISNLVIRSHAVEIVPHERQFRDIDILYPVLQSPSRIS